MKSICFITNKYPNLAEPSILVFLQQLVWSIADKGIECTVISPMPTNIYLRYKNQPYHTTEVTENGNKVEVFWPKYIGFGDSHKILGWSPAKLTTDLFAKAVLKTIQTERIEMDVIYAHFLEPAGVAAARIGRELNKPSFVAFGESNACPTIDLYGEDRIRKELSSLSGVIAVSSGSKEILIERNVVPKEKIAVFPNGYRQERFFPRDKKEARAKFGFRDNQFIVCFVGSFDNRKGTNRLSEAADRFDDVYVAFAGKGNLKPTAKNTIWAECVNNTELPWFYSAADIFVLPTLNEGCCNAIVEALACGLPIVSANRHFNDDILDDSCSIRINPESVDEIAEAIKKLRDDKMFRSRLADGSMAKRKELTLKQRSENIISFIDKKEKQE